jgi:hypothetical protein
MAWLLHGGNNDAGDPAHMDTHDFDGFARRLAAGLSRRTMLRQSARAALTSPLTLAGMTSVLADGKDKDADLIGTLQSAISRVMTLA